MLSEGTSEEQKGKNTITETEVALQCTQKLQLDWTGSYLASPPN